MNKTFVRIVFALLALSYVLSHFVARAHAQSSLGIGTNDAIVPAPGYFAGLMQWINAHQQEFYRSLTGALKAMREDGSKLWVLIGLSFAYGVFHAAGPGHGKAVISSYMLANEVALRRGVMLSFLSAFLQAATAIVLMGIVFLALRGTAIRMTDAAWFLETVSYAAIAAFGAWLLWTKLAPRLRGWIGSAPAHSLSAAALDGTPDYRSSTTWRNVTPNPSPQARGGLGGEVGESPSPLWGGVRGGGNFVCAEATHARGGEVCSTCGHSHAPDPSTLGGDRFDWRTAWSAVAAVGIRPCSGALIVLTFAFLNGLWAGGILSVLAMALGTGITVAILATLAVTAKNWAVAFAGDGRIGNAVHATIEIGGAALVMLLGLTLLAASLSA
ncbi:MAG: nickel/cobalt transporter [Rhizobiaceae bacterium]